MRLNSQILNPDEIRYYQELRLSHSHNDQLTDEKGKQDLVLSLGLRNKPSEFCPQLYNVVLRKVRGEI